MDTAAWEQLLKDYQAGPKAIKDAIAGMSKEQLQARPVPGKWSTHEVICHLTDAEFLYADRIKRVIIENEPALKSADPDAWIAKLAYPQRDLNEEVRLIESIRGHLARILTALAPVDRMRRGIHSADGPIALEVLLQRVTNHVPHHLRFVQEKRQALGLK